MRETERGNKMHSLYKSFQTHAHTHTYIHTHVHTDRQTERDEDGETDISSGGRLLIDTN